MAWPAILAAMGGMGGAGGAAAGGAVGGGGLFSGLLSSILGGAMSGGGGGGGSQGAPIQVPYRQGMQPGAPGGGGGGDGLWGSLGSFMMSQDEEGNSPSSSLMGAGMNAISRIPDRVSDSRTGPIGVMQHPVQGGVASQNPGLFGLNQLIAGSSQGGWGR